MKIRSLMTMAAAAAAMSAVSASAHHSFAAEFNADLPVDITGFVTKVEWANPHTFFYIDVEDEDGNFTNWAVELGSPNGLMRRGWTRNSLQIGDEVTVVGSQARDLSPKTNARTVTLSTGERMFAGS
ncbi:MAG: DUF6152 family protein, partial [Gammaproteobacteria bacterium]|nr:DUF6152 family protein [Gammaproteobacteria bacterium]